MIIISLIFSKYGLEFIHWLTLFYPLSTNPTKWSNTLKQFVGKLPTNCFSVSDHFVNLALKGLTSKKKKVTSANLHWPKRNEKKVISIVFIWILILHYKLYVRSLYSLLFSLNLARFNLFFKFLEDMLHSRVLWKFWLYSSWCYSSQILWQNHVCNRLGKDANDSCADYLEFIHNAFKCKIVYSFTASISQ